MRDHFRDAAALLPGRGGRERRAERRARRAYRLAADQPPRPQACERPKKPRREGAAEGVRSGARPRREGAWQAADETRGRAWRRAADGGEGGRSGARPRREGAAEGPRSGGRPGREGTWQAADETRGRAWRRAADGGEGGQSGGRPRREGAAEGPRSGTWPRRDKPGKQAADEACEREAKAGDRAGGPGSREPGRRRMERAGRTRMTLQPRLDASRAGGVPPHPDQRPSSWTPPAARAARPPRHHQGAPTLPSWGSSRSSPQSRPRGSPPAAPARRKATRTPGKRGSRTSAK